MKAPDFWWQPLRGAPAWALAPAGALYGAITAVRMRQPGAQLPVPVICVGNLIAGGAGKTPVTLTLAGLLTQAGHRPAILSRGYGRLRSAHRKAVLAVDLARHGADEVGDEPLLLARAAPTFVSTDRLAAAHIAMRHGADCLLLDDGLQNPALAKSVSIAVADGGSGIGNGLCVPAGPLRAPVAAQWPAVSMLCVIGPGDPGDRLLADAARHDIPSLRARLIPDPFTIERWRHRPLFAFAGIGRPEKFFETLRDAGMALTGTRHFPDHHRYKAVDLASLKQAAGDALLVTTAKDLVRLPPGTAIEALPVTLAFDEPGQLLAALRLSA